MGRIRRHRLVGLLLSAAIIAGGCAGHDQDGKATSRTPTPTSDAAAPGITKPCLHGVRSAEVIRFGTSAGAVLVGVVLGQGRTGLVLAHGRGSDLCEWFPLAQRFAKQGYRVFAFDFEGFGDSRPGSGPDARIDHDVGAAVEQLRRRGASAVILLGSSMGGTAVLSAATRIRPPVEGVVSLSGPGAFGPVDAWTATSRLQVPVLFVAAADDQPFVGAARAMYRRAPAADKRLLIARRGHGTAMLAFAADRPRVLAAVREFIADHVGP